jgi:hypothetical protein
MEEPMKVEIDAEFLGLGDVLADFLPAGAKPTALKITSTALRLDARAPLVGAVALTARVESAKGRMRLSNFDFEGSSLIRRTVLAGLREKIAGLDVRERQFRVTGVADGEALDVSWG